MSGELILFWDNLSNKTISLLKENKNIRLIKYNENNFEPLSIVQYRFILYSEFLKKNRKKYDEIFIADIRDIVFQKNPFEFSGKGKLNFFLEENKIVNCKTNKNLIKPFFEEKDNKEKILDNYISCAGTTIGKTERIIEYLNKMGRDIKRGNDQGLHNYLIYSGKIKNYKLFKNLEGPVLTLVSQDISKLKENKHGELINHDGSRINIIHQYDRFPEICEKFNVEQKNKLISNLAKMKFLGKIRRKLQKGKILGRFFRRIYQQVS